MKMSKTKNSVSRNVSVLIDKPVTKFKFQGDDAKSLVWTPAKGVTAGTKSNFVVVGWVPPKGNKLTGARYLSKARKYWSENDTPNKYSTDTIYIHDITVGSLLQHFSKLFSNPDDVPEDEVIPINITGPRGKVITNLKGAGIIPKAASSSSAIAWVNDVGFTSENFNKGEHKKRYTAIVKDEPVIAKAEYLPLTNERLEDIMGLYKLLNKGGVNVLDVNNQAIAVYPKELSKPINNIFTDKLIDVHGKIGKKKVLIISNLSSKQTSKVHLSDRPADVNMSSGEYGKGSSRPLDVTITFKREDYADIILDPGDIWTNSSSAVTTLFNEMEAVTSADTKISYETSHDKATVKSAVGRLLLRAQQDREARKLSKEAIIPATEVVGAQYDALGKKKKIQ